jgi:hypothetical protein
MKIFRVAQQPQAVHHQNPAKQQNPPRHQNRRAGVRVWRAGEGVLAFANFPVAFGSTKGKL